MKLTELRDIINNKFDVTIEIPTRKRHVVYAKKVYCTLAKSLNKYSLEKIGDCMNMPHDNVIYHISTVSKIYELHKIGFNEIVKDYNLNIDLMKVKEDKPVEIIVDDFNKIPTYILKHLKEYNHTELSELYETRLKPFKMMLDTRRKHKQIKHIIGARLKR